MKIIAFGTSNRAQSINKIFVSSVSKYYKEADDSIEILDLQDYHVELYSSSHSSSQNIPNAVKAFAAKIDEADFILLSISEDRAAYNNLIAWLGCIPNRSAYNNKPIFLLTTSLAADNAQDFLAAEETAINLSDGQVLATFALPDFTNNFEEGKGVTSILYRSQLEAKVRKTKRQLAAMKTA